MIYFDNSATTLPYPEAIKTYEEVATKIFGNPSSLHQLGSQSSRILQASRQQIAELLGKGQMKSFLLQAVQKEITGSLKVWPLKSSVTVNILLYLTLNIQQ